MKRPLVLILFLTFSLPFAFAQQTLTNDSVLKLKQAGLSEDLIVSTINSQPGKYSLEADDIVSLKQAGLSEKVLGAMILKNSGVSAPSALTTNNPDDPTSPHSPGIYILASLNGRGSHLARLERTAPSKMKSSGTFLSGMTYGIAKAHTKAIVSGTKAPIETAEINPTFYAYIPADSSTFGGNAISIKDFSIVHFEIKGDTRLINTSTVSPWGFTTASDQKSLQGFSSEEVKPGIYKLTLVKPLPVGEYAFQQGGVYYDFGILATQ